jgi:hypothetical protein
VDDKWIRKLRQCIDGGGEYLSWCQMAN